jgi:glycosyltransferase
MINLYIFSDTCVGTVYGVGTYIRELTAALKESDINICVVNIMSDKPQIQIEEVGGICHWYFPEPVLKQRTISDKKQMELYFHNVVYLLQLHIKDKKDLIFHFNFPQYESFVEKLRKAFDCRIVSVVHFSNWGFTVFDNLQRLRNILNKEHPNSIDENLRKSFEKEKSYYSKVDRSICLSNYMQEILCRDYGLDETKISVISNGLCDVADTAANTKLLRKKWNIQAGEKIILFAGRMDKVKGLAYLLKAFQSILVACPQSRLVIAGSGDFSKYIKDSQNICTKITYTGMLDKDQLYEWYSLADVGIIPSLFEPFGYVAVEMMMHRLPVVVTATSGMNEVVDDTCGLKVPIIKYPDKVEIDAGLLAEKILYLLQHPKEARKLGENGRKRYRQLYTSEIFGQKMFRFYQSLIEQ